MKRSTFLHSILPAAMLSMLPDYLKASEQEYEPMHTPLFPPYLQKGDVIGITCPAGFIARDDLQPALSTLGSWGFETMIGNTVGRQFSNMGGTDGERLQDLQQMLDNPNIKAILFARGGYGSVRIIDQLDFRHFSKHPKWLIGFSDITLLHAHLHRHTHVVSIHSKMCNSFPKDLSQAEPAQMESIDSIRRCLTGEPIHYETASHPQNITGKATGILIGGNLRCIETLAATTSDLSTAGKILFIEDKGEYLYSIDRMLWNLKRSGKLEHLAGLIIGGFRHKPSEDPAEEFTMTVEEMVLEKLPANNYPVCFNFPVGHQKHNVALLHGAKYQLTVTNQRTILNTLT